MDKNLISAVKKLGLAETRLVLVTSQDPFDHVQLSELTNYQAGWEDVDCTIKDLAAFDAPGTDNFYYGEEAEELVARVDVTQAPWPTTPKHRAWCFMSPILAGSN